MYICHGHLATDRAHHIDLYERDSSSPNDRLGFIRFPAGSLRPGIIDEIVLRNKGEGSIYIVKFSVDYRLADEKNGYVQASKWFNNKAYCFEV
ncbi:MAG: hypothetical protein ACJAVV_001688 [Alphaproteobacteria bacterium]|jgi:hypothetical protein